MPNLLRNLLDKASGREEERKVDILSALVERNKIKNSGGFDINDVVAFAKSQNIKHDIYL